MENNTFNRVVHIEPMYLWWMSIVNEAIVKVGHRVALGFYIGKQ